MERVAGGLLRGPCTVASELVLDAQSCSAQIYTSKPFEIDMHAFFFFFVSLCHIVFLHSDMSLSNLLDLQRRSCSHPLEQGLVTLWSVAVCLGLAVNPFLH